MTAPVAEPAGAVRPSSSSTPSASRRMERLVSRLALDLCLVDLVHLVARMREPVGELAVVREQEHAGGVCIQTTDGTTRRLVLDEADDGRPAVRVARVVTPTGLWSSTYASCSGVPTVEIHHVAFLDERVQLAGLAVHAHPPARMSSSAPRRDATPERAR